MNTGKQFGCGSGQWANHSIVFICFRLRFSICFSLVKPFARTFWTGQEYVKCADKSTPFQLFHPSFSCNHLSRSGGRGCKTEEIETSGGGGERREKAEHQSKGGFLLSHGRCEERPMKNYTRGECVHRELQRLTLGPRNKTAANV